MWAECVLPSLFPFMVITLIFIKTGIAEKAALPLKRSMGAVVGGCYAGGMTIEEIRKIALKLKKRDIIDVSPSITQMSLLRRGGTLRV